MDWALSYHVELLYLSIQKVDNASIVYDVTVATTRKCVLAGNTSLSLALANFLFRETDESWTIQQQATIDSTKVG